MIWETITSGRFCIQVHNIALIEIHIKKMSRASSSSTVRKILNDNRSTNDRLKRMPTSCTGRVVVRGGSHFEFDHSAGRNREIGIAAAWYDEQTHTHTDTNHLSPSCLCVYVACPSGSRREGGKRQCVLTVGPMSAALRRRNGLGRPIGRVVKTARPKTPG